MAFELFTFSAGLFSPSFLLFSELLDLLLDDDDDDEDEDEEDDDDDDEDELDIDLESCLISLGTDTLESSASCAKEQDDVWDVNSDNYATVV